MPFTRKHCYVDRILANERVCFSGFSSVWKSYTHCSCTLKELADEGWVEEIRTFKWGLVDSGDPYTKIPGLLTQAASDLGLIGKRIGYEGSFEFIAAPYVGAEPGSFSQVTMGMFQQAFGDNLVDATGLIHKIRLHKTPLEAEKLRLANRIASFGLKAFFENVVPGKTEIEVVSTVESAIMQGRNWVKQCKSCTRLGLSNVWASGCNSL